MSVAIVLNEQAASSLPRCPQAVAIGQGSVANLANTVSVGTNTARRRIVNVAAAVANSDAANLGQVKALVAASAQAAVSSSSRDIPKSGIEDIRQELAALHALINTQQRRIAELEKRQVAGASAQ